MGAQKGWRDVVSMSGRTTLRDWVIGRTSGQELGVGQAMDSTRSVLKAAMPVRQLSESASNPIPVDRIDEVEIGGEGSREDSVVK
jgi:hypothetical protein